MARTIQQDAACEICRTHGKTYDGLCAECEAITLRVDNDNLWSIVRENESLTAENEQLRTALKVHHDLGLWSVGHETCPECGQD